VNASLTIVIISSTIKTSDKRILIIIVLDNLGGLCLSFVRRDTNRVVILVVGLGVADGLLCLRK
jgi:hypothetical protein